MNLTTVILKVGNATLAKELEDKLSGLPLTIVSNSYIEASISGDDIDLKCNNIESIRWLEKKRTLTFVRSKVKKGKVWQCFVVCEEGKKNFFLTISFTV